MSIHDAVLGADFRDSEGLVADVLWEAEDPSLAPLGAVSWYYSETSLKSCLKGEPCNMLCKRLHVVWFIQARAEDKNIDELELTIG
jgi:hypothetical protein